MIPHPILTRWGSWLRCVEYHLQGNNFHKIKQFFESHDKSDKAAVESLRCIKKMLSGSRLMESLVELQPFVELPKIIEQLQKREKSTADQLKLLDKVRDLIKGTDHEKVLQRSLSKNVDLITFTKSTDLKQRLDRQFCPLTGAEVERSFSIYNWLLSANRASFKPLNVRNHMIVKFNDFL